MRCRIRFTPFPRRRVATTQVGLLTHRFIRGPSSRNGNSSDLVGVVGDYSGGAVSSQKSNFSVQRSRKRDKGLGLKRVFIPALFYSDCANKHKSRVRVCQSCGTNKCDEKRAASTCGPLLRLICSRFHLRARFFDKLARLFDVLASRELLQVLAPEFDAFLGLF